MKNHGSNKRFLPLVIALVVMGMQVNKVMSHIVMRIYSTCRPRKKLPKLMMI